MRHLRWATLALTAMALVALVGAVDAARTDEWDLVSLFAALGLVALVLVLADVVGRPAVPLRADLVRWLARRASVSGERTGDLADRAVVAYRTGLSVDEPSDDARRRR